MVLRSRHYHSLPLRYQGNYLKEDSLQKLKKIICEKVKHCESFGFTTKLLCEIRQNKDVVALFLHLFYDAMFIYCASGHSMLLYFY